MFNSGPGTAQVQLDLSQMITVRLPRAAWNAVMAGLWELPGKIGVPLIKELELQLAQQTQQAAAQNNVHEALADE